MTLQPMTTAPRDGSEALLVLTPQSAHNKGADKVAARWATHWGRWYVGVTEYSDAHFSGWLDIEALQRDAQRYRELAGLLNITDENYADEIAKIAGEIDKEAGRG